MDGFELCDITKRTKEDATNVHWSFLGGISARSRYVDFGYCGFDDSGTSVSFV